MNKKEDVYEIPNRVYVSGLPEDATEEELIDFFSNATEGGEIQSLEIIRFPETERGKPGKSRGFGFITFDSQKVASKLVKIQKLIFRGNDLYFDHARARENKRMFISKTALPPPTRTMTVPIQIAPQRMMPQSIGPSVAPPGFMDVATVNQLVMEAHMVGVRQGMAQAQSQVPMMGGLGGPPPSNLLQSLLPNAMGAAAPAAPPPVAAPPPAAAASNGSAATQLLEQLLQQSNPDALAQLINRAAAKGGEREPRASSASTSYSTSYPAPNTYDSYYGQQSSTSYGPVKDEDHKSRSYRPY